MPNYISKIDFGDGIQRKVRVQSSGGGITDFADIPTVEETELAYDGTQKELVFTGLDTEKVTVSGASATEVGTYTCTLTLKSNSYAWKDLTQEPKTIEWEIVVSDHIYGVLWDGTSTTTWTRTDYAADFTDPIPAVYNGDGSSPFDNRMPWSGMQRVEDAEAGTLVSIPKFWYKWTFSGNTMQLQIADHEQEGFFVSPAHMDRDDGGGERDVVYVGAYHCATRTNKSTTGVEPRNAVTRNEFKASIHNLGSDIWQWDFAMYWTICMLYLVEYADWNSQAKIGYGCGSTGSIDISGRCDDMIYHTGTDQTAINQYGHTRYRYIEDLWGNVLDFVAGIYCSSRQVSCTKLPARFDDSQYGTYIGRRPNTSGVVTKWIQPPSGFEYALFPSSVTTYSTNIYNCDYYAYRSNGTVVCVGGEYSNRSEQGGLFSIYTDNASSYSSTRIGSRLMKLP